MLTSQQLLSPSSERFLFAARCRHGDQVVIETENPPRNSEEDNNCLQNVNKSRNKDNNLINNIAYELVSTEYYSLFTEGGYIVTKTLFTTEIRRGRSLMRWRRSFRRRHTSLVLALVVSPSAISDLVTLVARYTRDQGRQRLRHMTSWPPTIVCVDCYVVSRRFRCCSDDPDIVFWRRSDVSSIDLSQDVANSELIDRKLVKWRSYICKK